MNSLINDLFRAVLLQYLILQYGSGTVRTCLSACKEIFLLLNRNGAMKMNENLGISAMHVCKSFGKETVLRDVSLTVKRGEIAGLVGNNGSGKTVLMKCICGFSRQSRQSRNS